MNGLAGDLGKTPAGAPRLDGTRLRRDYGRLALLGAVVLLAGAVGLVHTASAASTSMRFFGGLLLVGSLIGLLHTTLSFDRSIRRLAAATAVLDLAAGVLMLVEPKPPAAALAMSAALFFLIGAVFRLTACLVARGPRFGPVLVQAVLGLLLVVPALVLGGRPDERRYAVGGLFALSLLIDGLGLTAVGLGGRRLLRFVTDRTSGASEIDTASPKPYNPKST